MLCNISATCIEDAQRILAVLCFSARPLTVTELIDAHASNLDGSSQFSLDDRRLDVESLIEICSGLLELLPGQDASGPQKDHIARIAHYSVQEYLTSERIKQQKSAAFAQHDHSSNATIAQTCLAYLLESQLSGGILDEAKLRKLPFATYAAQYWHHHYEKSGDMKPQCENLILALFRSQTSFKNWIRLFSVDKQWRGLALNLPLTKIASPTY
jgi:hypothetical protein